jgi:NADPH:quinone reductase-like Zn-dependent oxidoreductase
MHAEAGSECVGAVLDSGSHPAGTWVYAECRPAPASPGSFATSVVVADDDVLPLPEGVDPVLATAVGANDMPGPYYDVSYDLVLVPDPWQAADP